MLKSARRLALAVAFAAAAIGGAGLAAPTQALAQPRFVSTESKYASIVMDASTGDVLYERNPDAQRYPASISKIMTLYLTFEALQTGRLKLTDELVVSQHAANMAPSKLGLRPGEMISVDEAMRAVAVLSANDMAVALAEKIGGSESRFAALMTLRAQELGMNNTHYVNATGLPDARQVSSARDIAMLSRAVMRDYPQYYSYFSIKEFDYHGRTVVNHNHLLGKMPGLDGLKTGFINASGFNLAASAVRDNRRLIAVVLGGNSTAARDSHVEDLLDTGFVVLQRRAMGQNVDFAQNLSEPAPIGLISRPPTEEGAADQEGVRIVLTNNEQASLPRRPGPRRDARTACTRRRGARRAPGASRPSLSGQGRPHGARRRAGARSPPSRPRAERWRLDGPGRRLQEQEPGPRPGQRDQPRDSADQLGDADGGVEAPSTGTTARASPG